MANILEVPQPAKQKFSFVINGKAFTWEYEALSTEKVEEIRASIPMPEPPIKLLFPGLNAMELKQKQAKGIRTSGPDFEDPDYKKAVQEWEDAVSMETVRIALSDQTPREEFARVARTRLPYGILSDLMRAVNAATFGLDAGLLERFLGNSVPSMNTDEDSSTLIENSSPKERDGSSPPDTVS